MVEQINRLDYIFGSLSDPTRRDILRKVSKKSMSVGEIALHYRMSFAAVAKHLNVLDRAKLITKRRRGKEQIVSISPNALAAAGKYLGSFEKFWEARLDNLDNYLKSISAKR